MAKKIPLFIACLMLALLFVGCTSANVANANETNTSCQNDICRYEIKADEICYTWYGSTIRSNNSIAWGGISCFYKPAEKVK